MPVGTVTDVLHGLAQVSLSRLLHLAQHHGRDLLRVKPPTVLPLPGETRTLGLPPSAHHLEGPVLHVRLHSGVCRPAPISRLTSNTVLCGFRARLALGHVARSHSIIRRPRSWGGAFTLVSWQDLHPAVLEHAHAQYVVPRSMPMASSRAADMVVVSPLPATSAIQSPDARTCGSRCCSAVEVRAAAVSCQPSSDLLGSGSTSFILLRQTRLPPPAAAAAKTSMPSRRGHSTQPAPLG